VVLSIPVAPIILVVLSIPVAPIILVDRLIPAVLTIPAVPIIPVALTIPAVLMVADSPTIVPPATMKKAVESSMEVVTLTLTPMAVAPFTGIAPVAEDITTRRGMIMTRVILSCRMPVS
jgi:hypothetical protein